MSLTLVKDNRDLSRDYPGMLGMPVNLSNYFPPRLSIAPALWPRLAVLAWAWAGLSATAQTAAPDAPRQAELVRMVRQDCGSCHGLNLTGGLGPALTRQALEGKPLDSMASTIYGGRPGTPMAPWKAMLTEGEAHWIAQQLLAGFPEPTKDPR